MLIPLIEHEGSLSECTILWMDVREVNKKKRLIGESLQCVVKIIAEEEDDGEFKTIKIMKIIKCPETASYKVGDLLPVSVAYLFLEDKI